jgi:hypothetical protein
MARCNPPDRALAPTLRGTAVVLFALSLFPGGGLCTYLAGLAIDNLGYPTTLTDTAVALVLFRALSWPLLRVRADGAESSGML